MPATFPTPASSACPAEACPAEACAAEACAAEARPAEACAKACAEATRRCRQGGGGTVQP
ncbi:hypothetical protein E3T34_15410 [Cryobacterium sp. TMT1-62]|nr:hypothetical protein E3T34_15410 [Cryobacterium sp. TMT1-62]